MKRIKRIKIQIKFMKTMKNFLIILTKTNLGNKLN
jgi:hypothetical protein